MLIILFGSVAILGKKIKNRANSSAVQPEVNPQHQGYNGQAGNDTILNVLSIIYVTIVLATIYVPTLLAGQKIIPPHPLFLVNTFYGLIYVPSLVFTNIFCYHPPKNNQNWHSSISLL
jgi:hypothetical protein